MRAELEHWLTAGKFFPFSGYRVFYRRSGRGPALLLIHGYPFNSFDWHRIWFRLTERYDVLAPDMLGMGFSDKPLRHHYSVLEHADMHEALLRAQGVEEVLILAHDLGVSVVQEMLARRITDPALPRIRAVAFLNGGLFPEVYRPRLVQRVLSSPAGDVLGPLLPPPLLRLAVREVFGPDTKPSAADMRDFLDIVEYNHGRWVNHKVGRFTLERVRYRERWVEPLAKAVVPLRFINGAVDPNSGAHMAARYREVVPDPDVVSLDRIGHWPQLEAPEATFEAADAFFTGR
ncbi:alpha/beta fold hydrolase [Nocardia otitidiscaviarum]|uniref:Alpha/beta hydrolase n=1 Tax=Nocardia otitidiscaviarum TaxID=1823 RepID=A0A516NVN7_9NOCA|nr:alpha/beta hydrolase [Nocardia otitidiscaviarum]MBF6182898.1 alpha/beta hydrolase [Nocardia otitidiscaviarum]MCP9622462.1 alpha/beta hydrolase [Nocardia otitidiscaviarum]QDP82975.1 alpha/beta hydrolase [Nocardia otitidiscaviarum]